MSGRGSLVVLESNRAVVHLSDGLSSEAAQGRAGVRTILARARGFTNLEKARAARSLYSARRREWYRINGNREHRYAYVPPAGKWRCDCGLEGDSTGQIYRFYQQTARLQADLYARKKTPS